MLWDVFLQAVGIFFTVVILGRYFEHREEMRWRPARHYLYHSLFSDADWLLGLLPHDMREGQPMAAYRFDQGSFLSQRYGSDFYRRLVRLRPLRLREVVGQFAEDPTLLESFKQSLDTSLGYTGGVFLARELELNRILGELRGWMSGLEANLEGYREVLQSGTDPARVGGSTALEQACIPLRETIVTGYQLRSWLAQRTVAIEPFDPEPADPA